jgi:molecular chaperone HtpG
MTSLNDYIQRAGERAGETDKHIYYLIGEDENILRNSPLLEAYKKADIEVLIMDDKEIDEIVTPAIGAYKEWTFTDITTVEAPESLSEEEQKELQEKHKKLTQKLKEILGDAVKEVKVTTRLDESPSCVVPDSSDPMAGMAHVFRQMGQEMPDLPLILEINPEHPMIQKLEKIKKPEKLEAAAWVLLDSAKLAEGLEPEDKTAFARRVTDLLGMAL